MVDKTDLNDKHDFTISITGENALRRGRAAYRSRLMSNPEPVVEKIPETKQEKRAWAEDKTEVLADDIEATLPKEEASGRKVALKILGWWAALSAIIGGVAYVVQNDENQPTNAEAAITQTGEQRAEQTQEGGQEVKTEQDGQSEQEERSEEVTQDGESYDDTQTYITQNIEDGIRYGIGGNSMPVYAPRPISLNDIPSAEYNGHLNLLNGLQGTPGLTQWIDREIVYAITTNLQSDMSLSDAIEQGKNDTLSWIGDNFKRDASGRPDGNGFWLHSRTVGSQMACVRAETPFITNAVRFRSRVVAANLAGYNDAQALNMLKTFGGLMLDPELGKHATEAAQKDPEAIMDRQRVVIGLTTKLIESGRMSSHEALCTAVRRTRVHEDRPMPSDFFIYVQGERVMAGKNKDEQISALRAEDKKIETDRHNWFYRNAGILLALSVVGFVGFKVKEWHDSTR
ncbi:MAG: hypothetical protein IKY98_02425 [Alphaproteobacteria bacterium]|nr:hypothetical protein [Alphaproteobacteria bacterium]